MRFYSSIASEATLSSGISNSDTAITVEAATGYPANTPYTVVLDPDTAGEEIVEVTDVSGATWTITRGVDGSVALPHDAGAKIRHMGTARDFQESRNHEDASTGVHGLGVGEGAVVGTSKTQTFTGKTIDGGSNTLQNIAQASVTGLVSGLASINSELDGVGNDLVTHEADNGNVHGLASGEGAVVGTSKTQTLTAKTINRSSNNITVHKEDTEDRYFLVMELAADVVITGGALTRFSWNVVNSKGTWASDGHTSRRRVPKSGLYRVDYTTSWEGTPSGPDFYVSNQIRNVPLDGTGLGTQLAVVNTHGQEEDFSCHASGVFSVNSDRAIALYVFHVATLWTALGDIAKTRVAIEYLGPAS